MAGRDYVAPDDVQAMLPQAIAQNQAGHSGAAMRPESLCFRPASFYTNP